MWRAALQALFVLLLLALTFFVAGPRVRDASLRQTFGNTQAVIAAVESYRAEHGSYPGSLATVERNQGRALPRPTFDREFHYRATADGFELAFDAGLLNLWYYNSQTGRWVQD